MAAECPSQPGTPAETEDGAILQLMLITLAGEEIQLPVNVREHDRQDELEDAGGLLAYHQPD